MITVSDAFRAAVGAPTRMTKARLTFEVLDVNAWLDNTKTASPGAVISRLDQVTNRKRHTPGAYATWEPNRWKLDGSFVLPPRPDETEYEVGWWSEALCDDAGAFTPAQQIVITCGGIYNAAGITVTFDPEAGEYASDFTLIAYDGSGGVIHQEIVAGNTKTVYLLERVIPQFKRIELTITKWCKGYRRARVVEIDFGMVQDYGESELISLDIIEDLDAASRSLPTNELRFQLDNLDKRFNIMNPTGLHYFLQRRQRVLTEIGVEVGRAVEYVPMGTYYLTDWKSDEGAMTASFVARDAMDLLAHGTYRKGLRGTTTLYALAETVLQDAGITAYEIDLALQTVEVSGALPLVSHRDALQMIAIAGRAVAYADRTGKVMVERLSSTVVGVVDMDNVYRSPSIALDKLVNAVDVDVVSYRAKGTVEVYNGSVTVDGTAAIWVEYQGPCEAHSVVVTGAALVSAEHYTYASKLTITGSGVVDIAVTATELEQVKSIYHLQDDDKPANEQTQGIRVSNPLINSSALAAEVAGWLLDESKHRLIYTVNWRQNPALECGDVVTIEDDLGGNKAARISRQELTWAGYLTGATTAKGGT